MDNDTVVLVFGDPGMTDNGGHGGETNGEIRTVLFAYSKGGLPIKSHSNPEVRRIFDSLHRNLKQLDMPSILASILDLELPFSNLGVLHPYLYLNKDGGLSGLYGQMVKQVKQIHTYINEYCKKITENWCKDKVSEITNELQRVISI